MRINDCSRSGLAFGLLSCGILALLPASGYAAEKRQTAPPAKNAVIQETTKVELIPDEGEDSLEVVRAQLRMGKTAVLARSLRFSSDEQAEAFWQLYRQYQTDYAALNDKRLGIVKDYLTSYDSLDDAGAKSIMDRSLAAQLEMVQLRQKYAKQVADKVSPLIAASFLQIDGLLQSIVDLEAKSSLPLIADRLAVPSNEERTAENTK